LCSGRSIAKSHFARVFTEDIYGQLYVYLQGRPVQIQTPTHYKFIDSSMTTPPTALSPNRILPLTSHCAFIPAEKNPAPGFEMLLFDYSLFKIV
jgi:hypothetical protein